MSRSTVLRHVMLLQRDVPKAAQYYSEGLGLPVRVVTEKWAELDAGGTTIALKHASGCGFARLLRAKVLWCAAFDSALLGLDLKEHAWAQWVCREAFTTTGYSPFLAFTVSDLQGTLQRLLPLGAEMDGPIRFVSAGQLVALRNPDGQMMSLFEPDAASQL
jgi:catechol 2,3-dioxygenase-like lactoylglutathione lyase family enzyme